MRYGLGDNGNYGEAYYLREISKEIGVTRERIRQVEGIILNKLRQELKDLS